MEREFPTLEEVRIGALQAKVLENVYNQTKERLKNAELEELTEEDLYILYLTETLHYEEIESLHKPEIQQLLIKHKFINALLYRLVDYIEDKQVIKDLLSSKEFVESNFIIKPVTITNIEIEKIDENVSSYYITIHFIDKETQTSYSIEIGEGFELTNAKKFKDEITSNKDNMSIILDSKRNKPITLIKYYEGII